MAGRTYRYYNGDPLYPFGYGLSYSKFTYESMRVAPATITVGQSTSVNVTVRNEGPYDADEVSAKEGKFEREVKEPLVIV